MTPEREALTHEQAVARVARLTRQIYRGLGVLARERRRVAALQDERDRLEAELPRLRAERARREGGGFPP